MTDQQRLPLSPGSTSRGPSTAALYDLLEASIDDTGITLTARQRMALKARFVELVTINHFAVVGTHQLDQTKAT